MKAITVKLPWAWLLIHSTKDIENRNWFNKHKGKTAIHCSKTIERGEYEAAKQFIQENGLEVQIPSIEALKPLAGKIIGTVEIVGCVNQSESCWFVGRFGFVCRSPKSLPNPVVISGALGFWEIPAKEGQMVEMQIAGGE